MIGIICVIVVLCLSRVIVVRRHGQASVSIRVVGTPIDVHGIGFDDDETIGSPEGVDEVVGDWDDEYIYRYRRWTLAPTKLEISFSYIF